MLGYGLEQLIGDEDSVPLSLGDDWLIFPNLSAVNLIKQMLEAITGQEYRVVNLEERLNASRK